MRFYTSFLILSVCIAVKSFGQNELTNASSARETIAYPVALYKAATSQSQNLYNGRQYYMYDSRSEEHQFFLDRKWKKGSVLYDGQLFDSIPMLYDIFQDELVIKHFNGDDLLLQSEKTDYFEVNGHRFERMEAGKNIDAQMRTGFYDVLYNGKTRTLVRRSKQRQETIQDKRVTALFPQKDFFYISKNGRYNAVHSRKSVFSLFPEHKKELRKVLKDQKIRFKKNRELAIARIVAAYDELARL
ncbi:hypothetical protein [Dyadobacter flavalbus]|uniref:hypothetical protein n=1 Tax=Dyadobacter flavalbus TaxID=2579942 RepID=UPI001E432F63|nr:hypothetical protein [Dyadobacter flavalbus]